jgi:hypothetical protein
LHTRSSNTCYENTLKHNSPPSRQDSKSSQSAASAEGE